MRFLLALLLLTTPLFAEHAQKSPPIEEPKLLSLGIGVFNIVRNTKSVNFQLEYRPDFPIYRNRHLFFRPLVGMMATTQGSFYIYGGIAFDIFLSKHFVFTPSFAPGIYFKGGGIELGLPLEFRSSAEIAYRFANRSRLGAMFYHLSNASLGYKNPGTECLVFFYAFSL